jgi:serine/threonine-protein kinase
LTLNLVGRSLCRFQIKGEIRRGGMGTVYRGYDPDRDCQVAIKVLAPHLAWERPFVARFLREARTVSRISHPNIVNTVDVGRQDGVYYLVMDYIEGESLSHLISREAPLSPQHAAEIVAQVADALDYAHQQGIVHRDVKPGNILIEPGGEVKLTDFGIAQGTKRMRLTAEGTSMGTPEYMSPEQAMGAPASPASDVYSLGIVLYEMLTGRVPFSGETPVATLRLQADVPPEEPRSIVRTLPRAVDKVVLKALGKQPDARYSSAGALARALAEALEPPVPAQWLQRITASSPVERARRWWRGITGPAR